MKPCDEAGYVRAIMLLVLIFATVLPVPKDGPCPPLHSSYGAYCVPQRGAGQAVPKRGPCPTGMASSGKYCVRKPQR